MHRSIHGHPYAAWTTESELLAAVHFQLAVANAQRAGKKGKKPKPIERPKDKSKKRLGFGTPTSLDALDALIGWKSPRTRE